MGPKRRAAFADELAAGWAALAAGDPRAARHRFSRAHILGQRPTLAHLRAHWGLLRAGLALCDAREVRGQIGRLLGALFFTWIWVPAGNPGTADVSAFAPAPIPDDLRALLD